MWGARAILLLALTGGLWLGSSRRVNAAASGLSLTVNNAADLPDWNPGDGVCETGNGNHVCTLRAAIMEANAYLGTDVINLQQNGYYTLSRGGEDDNATNGDLDITERVTIYGHASTVDGGGLDRVFDVPNPFTFLTINDLTIYNGHAHWHGGGIRNNGFLTLNNVTIDKNLADGDGGGIYNTGSASALTATNVDITNNIANGDGAGIETISGNILLAASSVAGNESKGSYGGGIDIYTGNVTLRASTLNNNVSHGNGGGIAAMGTNAQGALVKMINSTVANNTAASNGGGIYNNGGQPGYESNFYLYNTTVAHNLAITYSGGGISLNTNFPGYVNIANSLLADNHLQSINGPLQDCKGSLVSQDYNLIRTTSGCTVTGATAHNKTNIVALESILFYFGGPTPTVALQPGSPAIDAGNPAGCLDDYGVALTTDQRGSIRPVGGRCDIGAYEDQSALSAHKLYLPVVVR
jgi:hypothetical protein